jgi:hypothetical protein
MRMVVAAFVAALLSLSGASIASAGNGNGGGSNSTATAGPGNSGQGCDGTHHSDTGHGANQGGPYDNTCDGSPSGNGNGNGQATGKPCAGCVGNADDKNPKGQMPNGSDHNAGYECDRNHGIGRTNPAHTGCQTTTTVTPPPPPPNECPGGDKNGDEPGCESSHGNNPPPNETPPPKAAENPPPAAETPAEVPAQAVLGERKAGQPDSPPAVLGVQRSGGSNAPEQAAAPAEAQETRPASGSLPLTGSDALLILLLAGAALAAGIGLRRLMAQRS